jgi:murein DD-endopeptidase MepM/ murein hydrolase activator NlpD
LVGRLRGLLACMCIIGLVSVGSAAAHADPLKDRQNANSQKRQQLQQQLDAATASDAALQAEADRLNAAVSAQQSTLSDVRQAEAAARAQADAAAHRLTELQARTDAARQLLSQRAVEAYVQPSKTTGLIAMTQAKTLDEAVTRQTFVDLLQGQTVDAIDAMRGAKEDEATAKVELTKAQQVASQRTKAEADQLATLVSSQNAAHAAEAQNQARIASLAEESRQLASEDANIRALIEAQAPRPAAVAPSVAASPSAKASGSGSAPASASVKPSAAGFIWPISGPVTSEFGPRSRDNHPGIDIAGPYGGAIAASKSGTVIYAQFNDGGYGNLVVIDHGGGFATAYGHQSRLNVSVGESVSQGQVIGYEGSTGASTGPHVHFEVRVNGTVQNPRNYLAGDP